MKKLALAIIAASSMSMEANDYAADVQKLIGSFSDPSPVQDILENNRLMIKSGYPQVEPDELDECGLSIFCGFLYSYRPLTTTLFIICNNSDEANKDTNLFASSMKAEYARRFSFGEEESFSPALIPDPVNPAEIQEMANKQEGPNYTLFRKDVVRLV